MDSQKSKRGPPLCVEKTEPQRGTYSVHNCDGGVGGQKGGNKRDREEAKRIKPNFFNLDSGPPPFGPQSQWPLSQLPECYSITGWVATCRPLNMLKMVPCLRVLHSFSQQLSISTRSQLALPRPPGYKPRPTPHPLFWTVPQYPPTKPTSVQLHKYNLCLFHLHTLHKAYAEPYDYQTSINIMIDQ